MIDRKKIIFIFLIVFVSISELFAQIGFVENKGQWNTEVKYLFRHSTYNAWLTDFGIVYEYFTNVVNPNNEIILVEYKNHNFFRYLPYKELITKYNYFMGNDKSKWSVNVSLFEEIIVKNVYKDINVRYYIDSNNDNNLRYDFIVEPFANFKDINISVVNAKTLNVVDNEIIINNSIKHSQLFAYQCINDKIANVNCKFSANDSNSFGFTVDDYNITEPLIIDPLIYSIIIGGNESERAYAIDVDKYGCAYITGDVYSANYPITYNNFQQNINKGANNQLITTDVFISKFAADGKTLLYSTFIGGQQNDAARCIKIDSDGNIYVGGQTNSLDSVYSFPHKSDYYYFNDFKGGWDVFVTKINPNMTTAINQLSFSAIMGGSDNDEIGEIAFMLDTDLNISAIVVAMTIGINGLHSYVPPITTAGVVQANTAGGLSDGYVAMLSKEGDSILAATLISGDKEEKMIGVVVDTAQNIYVVGNTNSTNLPVTNTSAYSGEIDAIIYKINNQLSSYSFGTYLGGNKQDSATGIDIDNFENVYIAGVTKSADFPLTSGAFNQSVNPIYDNIFLAKINTMGVGLIYSTSIYATNAGSQISQVAVDNSGKVHFTGFTNDSTYPVSWDAFFTESSQYGDAVYTVLGENGDEIIFSSFIGGGQYEYGYGLAIDSMGVAYICGTTNSGLEFPHSKSFSDSVLIRYDTINGVPIPIWVKTLGNYDAFVYKATYKPYPGELVTNINSLGNVFCPGHTIQISIYTPFGFYFDDNIFSIQLSDTNGNFNNTNPNVIGTLSGTTAGELTITLPITLLSSNKYRIRAVSSHPRSIGADNGTDLNIRQPYIYVDTISFINNICAGDTIQVPINTNSCFSEENKFSVQLSNNEGVFNPITVLASNINQLNTNDTIVVIIPDTLTPSSDYKLRIIDNTNIISNVVSIIVDVPNIDFDSTIVMLNNLCTGDPFSFDFFITNCFNNDNIFYLVLSDQDGNFTDIDTIASVVNDGSTNKITISGSIPDKLVYSDKYLMKLISTSPYIERILSTDVIQQYTLGEPYIYTDNLLGMSFCLNDDSISVGLMTHGCFTPDNIFVCAIYTNANGWIPISTSTPNLNMSPIPFTITLSRELLLGKDTIWLRFNSTEPLVYSDSIPVIINYPSLVLEAATLPHCLNTELELYWNTPNCVKDSSILSLYLYKEVDGTLIDSSLIDKYLFVGDSGSLTVDRFSHSVDTVSNYFLQLKDSVGNIYNVCHIKFVEATIQLDSFSIDWCVDGSINVASGWFSKSNCFDEDNIFVLQMLQDTDDATWTDLDSIFVSDSIFEFTWPDSLPDGDYNFRIVSTSPVLISDTLTKEINSVSPFILLTETNDILSGCVGDNLSFMYKSSECFTLENKFELEISSTESNDWIKIGESTDISAGSFECFIPFYIEAGEYKVRITSTSPALIFEQNLIFTVGVSSIITGNIRNPLRRNDTLFVPFHSVCVDSTEMLYVVELSDAYGNFIKKQILNIGQQYAKDTGKIYCRIPLQASDGMKYRFRVVCKVNPNDPSQDIVGVDNGSDIIIFGIIYNDSTSIEDISDNNNEITIYPNPVIDIMDIQNISENTIQYIRVVDLIGKQHLYISGEKFISENNISLDVSSLIGGTYVISVATNKKLYHKLVVKL